MNTISVLPDVGIELREGYAEVGDVNLHYVEAGDGPLIVLLHGFPEFWYGWRLQIAPLAAAGFRVVAPDTRGYNLSSKPEGFEAYAVDQGTYPLNAGGLGLTFHRQLVMYNYGGVTTVILAILCLVAIGEVDPLLDTIIEQGETSPEEIATGDNTSDQVDASQQQGDAVATDELLQSTQPAKETEDAGNQGGPQQEEAGPQQSAFPSDETVIQAGSDEAAAFDEIEVAGKSRATGDHENQDGAVTSTKTPAALHNKNQKTDPTANLAPPGTSRRLFMHRAADGIQPTGKPNPMATEAVAQAPAGDERNREGDPRQGGGNPTPRDHPIADIATNKTTAKPEARADSGQTDKADFAAGGVKRPSLALRSSVQERGAPANSVEDKVVRVRFVQRVAQAFHVASERGGQVRLRLSPPELGSLRLDVAIRDGVMTARIEVETTAARNVLLENLPQLRERLMEQNIKIERFDVDLMDNSSEGATRPPEETRDEAGRRQAAGQRQPDGDAERDREDDRSQVARSPVRPGHGEQLNVVV